MSISIHLGDPNSEAALQLMRELLEEEARRYSDMGPDDSDSFKPEQALDFRGAFLIASLDGQPVGCSALRKIDEELAEIKRMYVIASARRLGIARAMLAELERLAVQYGYRAIRLETGDRQPEAIAFYERGGFRRIPPYGEHIGDPVSVCLEKEMLGRPNDVNPGVHGNSA